MKILTQRKMGVSQVLASIIMISITIAGGLTVWSYVNTTTMSVRESYGEDVVSDINDLSEDFIITYIGLNATLDTVSIWLYNTGSVETSIAQILIWTASNSTATGIPASLTLPKSGTGNTTVSHPVTSGETYYVKTVGRYGSTYTAIQKAN